MLSKTRVFHFLFLFLVHSCSGYQSIIFEQNQVDLGSFSDSRGLLQEQLQDSYKSNITVGQRLNPKTGKQYTGGLNFTSPDYIGSLAFTAAPGVIIAVFVVIFIVLYSLIRCCICCCANEGHCFRTDKRPTLFQGCCRVFFLLISLLVSLCVVGGVVLMFYGAARTKKADTQIFKFIDTQLKDVSSQLSNISSQVSQVQQLPIDQSALSGQLSKIVQPVNNYRDTINNVDNVLQKQAQPLSQVNLGIRIVCFCVGAIAVVLILVILLGFCCKFNSCLLFSVLYVGALVTIVTFLLAAFSQVVFSVFTDSCLASLQYIQAPNTAAKDSTDIGRYLNCAQLQSQVPISAITSAKQGVNAVTNGVNLLLLYGSGNNLEQVAGNLQNILSGNAAPASNNQNIPSLCIPFDQTSLNLSTCPYPQNFNQVPLYNFNATFQNKLPQQQYNLLAGGVNNLAQINGSVNFISELRTCSYLSDILQDYYNQQCKKGKRSLLLLLIGTYVTGGAYFVLMFSWCILMPYIYNKRNLYSKNLHHQYESNPYDNGKPNGQGKGKKSNDSKYKSNQSDFPSPYENDPNAQNKPVNGNRPKV